MATVTVLYPQECKFDVDYYKKTHMPLVQEHWGPYNLTSWQITQLPGDAPYKIQATLQFKSMGDFQAAASSDAAKTVLGDVENFTDAKPVIMPGEVILSS